MGYGEVDLLILHEMGMEVNAPASTRLLLDTEVVTPVELEVIYTVTTQVKYEITSLVECLATAQRVSEYHVVYLDGYGTDVRYGEGYMVRVTGINVVEIDCYGLYRWSKTLAV